MSVREFIRVDPAEAERLVELGWRPRAASRYGSGQISVLLVNYPWMRDDAPAGDEAGDWRDR